MNGRTAKLLRKATRSTDNPAQYKTAKREWLRMSQEDRSVMRYRLSNMFKLGAR